MKDGEIYFGTVELEIPGRQPNGVRKQEVRGLGSSLGKTGSHMNGCA